MASIETEVENDSALDREPNADTALMAVNGSEPTVDLVDAERSCSATHWCERACKRAGSRIRTDDLLITNQLLYQLSYAGEKEPRRLTYKAAVNKLLLLFAEARIRGERFRRLQILDDGAEIHRFGIKGFVLRDLGAI